MCELDECLQREVQADNGPGICEPTSQGLKLKERGEAWDHTDDDDGQSWWGERNCQIDEGDGTYAANSSPGDLPGIVQDVDDDEGDIDLPVTITGERDAISEQNPLHEPYDLSDDDAPLAPISERHALFELGLLSESLNFGRAH
jgi:hypothetical protein